MEIRLHKSFGDHSYGFSVLDDNGKQITPESFKGIPFDEREVINEATKWLKKNGYNNFDIDMSKEFKDKFLPDPPTTLLTKIKNYIFGVRS